jgi:hypothetical protein
MLRSIKTTLAGIVVLAASAGCAYQDPFSLPDLTPRGAAPSAQVYPSYGFDFGYGYGHGGGYPNVYQPGYGYSYGYANHYYAAQGLYPYGYGYPYNPGPRYVVVPCAESDRNGRCDAPPPKQRHDHDQHGHVAPARPRQQAVPAAPPVVQRPARVRPEPRRATPLEAASQRGPRAGSGRPSTSGNDVSSSRPTQEP